MSPITFVVPKSALTLESENSLATSGFSPKDSGQWQAVDEGIRFTFQTSQAAQDFLTRLSAARRVITIPARKGPSQTATFSGKQFEEIKFGTNPDSPGELVLFPPEDGAQYDFLNRLWLKDAALGVKDNQQTRDANTGHLHDITTVVMDGDGDMNTTNDQVRFSQTVADQIAKAVQTGIGAAKRIDDFKQAYINGEMVQTPWGLMKPLPAVSNASGRVTYQVALINDAGQAEFFNPPLLNPITRKPERGVSGQVIMTNGHSHLSVVPGHFDLSDAVHFGWKAPSGKNEQPPADDAAMLAFLSRHAADNVYVTLASDGTMIPVVRQYNTLPRCTPEQHAFFTEIQAQFTEPQMTALAEYLEIPALVHVKQDGGDVDLSGLCLDDLAHILRNTGSNGQHTFKINTAFDRQVLARDIAKLKHAIGTSPVTNSEIVLTQHLTLSREKTGELLKALQAIESGDKTASEMISDFFYWVQHNPVPSLMGTVLGGLIMYKAYGRLMRPDTPPFTKVFGNMAARHLRTFNEGKYWVANHAGETWANILARKELLKIQRSLQEDIKAFEVFQNGMRLEAIKYNATYKPERLIDRDPAFADPRNLKKLPGESIAQALQRLQALRFKVKPPSTIKFHDITNVLREQIIEPGIDLTRATYQTIRSNPLSMPRMTLRAAASRTVGAVWNALGAAGAVMIGDDLGGLLVKQTEDLAGLNKDPDYLLNAFVFNLISSEFAHQGGLGGTMAGIFSNTFKAFASVGTSEELIRSITQRRRDLVEATQKDTAAVYALLGKLAWRSQDAGGRIDWRIFQEQVKVEYAVSNSQISALYHMIHLMTGTTDGNRQTEEGRDLVQAIRINGEVTSRFENSAAYRLILQSRDAYQQAVNANQIQDQPYAPPQPAPALDLPQDVNPATPKKVHQRGAHTLVPQLLHPAGKGGSPVVAMRPVYNPGMSTGIMPRAMALRAYPGAPAFWAARPGLAAKATVRSMMVSS